MRTIVAAMLLGLVLCAPAGAHGEKLTPAETTWATPVLKTWSTMNDGLRIVVTEEEASNALYAGSPNNGKLVATLGSFVQCGSEVKKAGAPPTARLRPFDASLTTMCAHLAAGANDVAKAVSAIRKDDSALAKQRIKAGYDEFVAANTLLKQAASEIVALGGSSSLSA